MTLYKVYSEQYVEVLERTNEVDISEEDIEAIINWSACPYDGGKNWRNLCEYLAGVVKDISDWAIEIDDNTPDVIKRCYNELYENRTINQVWNNLKFEDISDFCITDKSGEVLKTIKW